MTAPTTIEDGVVVLFEYTLSLPDGEVVESCVGEGPLPYLHGAHNIVPGLEKHMAGKSVGDRFQAVVEPEEAYGPHDGTAPDTVPRAELPEGIEEGMPILAELPDGNEIELWILELTDDTALLSQNHPLAGVALTFDVEIKGLRAATAEELEHGHPAELEDDGEE